MIQTMPEVFLSSVNFTPHICRESAMELVHLPEDVLFASACAMREKAFGKQVELCAIINARSGKCNMDCSFCSQSSHHQSPAVPSFELLSANELIGRLQDLSQFPLRHVGIVTSGGALSYEHVQSLVQTLELLPAHWQGRICGSLGRLPSELLEILKSAGLKRYHHNLESSEKYYPKLCTTQSWQERLATVHRAKSAGLEYCTGGLFGLGESWEDRIDFAFTLQELGVKHVPINFLYAHKGTPLEHMPPLSSAEALRIIAVFRHILPSATLRICGGRPTILGQRQEHIFAAGANALMTGNYLTTAGKGIEVDCRMITEQGLEIVTW